jgi:hypothetical protein
VKWPEEAHRCFPVLRKLIKSSSEFALQIAPLARQKLAVN